MVDTVKWIEYTVNLHQQESESWINPSIQLVFYQTVSSTSEELFSATLTNVITKVIASLQNNGKAVSNTDPNIWYNIKDYSFWSFNTALKKAKEWHTVYSRRDINKSTHKNWPKTYVWNVSIPLEKIKTFFEKDHIIEIVSEAIKASLNSNKS